MTGNADALVEEFAGIVGAPNVASSPPAVDGLEPILAVSPADASEVASILELANREKLTVLPRGGGTKFDWGGRPRAADLILETSRLNRIVDYDVPNLTVTVEAGAPLAELQEVVASQGNFLPLDAPFAEATVGGVLATNSSGPKRLLYGSARDLTLGLRAVLPRGDRLRFGGKVMKNVAGYDMTKLFIGSFGTLSVLTEATFRLLPMPEMERTLLVSFTSLQQAAQAVTAIRASQLVPSAIELMNRAGWQRLGGTGDTYRLGIDLEGFHEAVERQLSDLQLLVDKEGGQEITIVEGEEQSRLWHQLRDWGCSEPAAETPAVGIKASVPLSCVADIFHAAEKQALAYGLDCALRAHAGHGIVHVCLSNPQKHVGTLVSAILLLQHAAGDFGGSAIVEWGPWALRERVAVWGDTRPEWAMMRRLKSEFDPADILNPGRFVGGI